MSNIMEEEQIIKEDSCHRLSPVKGVRMKDREKVLVFKFQINALFTIYTNRVMVIAKVHLIISCAPGSVLIHEGDLI